MTSKAITTPGALDTLTDSKPVISPTAFAERCSEIVGQHSGHQAHRLLDQLVTETLSSLGYYEGMTIFLAHVREHHPEPPTLDSLRASLLDRAAKYATKRRGCLGTNRWARAHGILQSRVSEFLGGQRPPNDELLAALGFERRIVPITPKPLTPSPDPESYHHHG